MFNYEKSKDESWWKTLRSAGNTREIQRTITSANLTQTEEAVTSALRRKGTSLALRGWIWKADDGATSNAAGQHHPALLLALVCMHTTREINLKSLQQCQGTQAPAALCSTNCSSRCGNKQERSGSQQRNRAALGYVDLSLVVSSARRERLGIFMHLPLWGRRMVNY